MNYKTIELNSWEKFKNLAEHSILEWVFRGQSNSKWEIRSSLERSGIMTNFDYAEINMLDDFKRASNHYLRETQIPETLIDWLALLQHYGAPTRMIDFTKSPYVAAYFAFENIENDSESVAIWIANKIHFYQGSINYLKNTKIKKIKGNRYSILDSTFSEIFHTSREGNLDLIIPLESYTMNERYYLQQSVFLSPCNPYKPFIEQLGFLNGVENESLIKVILPKSERNKALRDLERMNITRASLFPGLEGFAKSLHLKFSTIMSINDMAENLRYLKKNKLI